MYAQIPPLAAVIAVANAHGVILAAQGEPGSPPSVGFQGLLLPYLWPQAFGGRHEANRTKSVMPSRETARP